MDRKAWQRWLPSPSWPCPACQTGHLRLRPETQQEVASRRERLEQAEPDAQSDESLVRFVALMKCDHPRCGETATIAGNRYSLWVRDGDEGFADDSYEALSIVPSPLPFRLGEAVPAGVQDVIRAASGLFWMDQRAAANRCREALEAILTNLTVPEQDAKGRDLRLHDRIKHLAAMDGGKWAEQAEMIEAAKWIGNEGTHATIDREDALDAFELLETAIDDIYVKRRHAVLGKARARNALYKKAADD